LLETVILQAGHEVIFYPKFHCELNNIEYYWAALKRYTREHCKYSLPELEKMSRTWCDRLLGALAGAIATAGLWIIGVTAIAIYVVKRN